MTWRSARATSGSKCGRPTSDSVTHFLQSGGAVTDLQQQLGHAELATTQIYASAPSERRRAAVRALVFGAPRSVNTAPHRAP